MLKLKKANVLVEGTIVELGSQDMVITNYHKNGFGTIEDENVATIDLADLPNNWYELSADEKRKALRKWCREHGEAPDFLSEDVIKDTQ